MRHRSRVTPRRVGTPAEIVLDEFTIWNQKAWDTIRPNRLARKRAKRKEREVTVPICVVDMQQDFMPMGKVADQRLDSLRAYIRVASEAVSRFKDFPITPAHARRGIIIQPQVEKDAYVQRWAQMGVVVRNEADVIEHLRTSHEVIVIEDRPLTRYCIEKTIEDLAREYIEKLAVDGLIIRDE